jgi:Zn-dependent M28 family amino/carboxypeptidase
VLSRRIAALAVALTLPHAASAAPDGISGPRMLQDIQTLASDAFEGRGPATPGETRTVDYLVAQMKAAGLAPAGDPLLGGGRAWTQDVPLVRFTFDGAPKVSARLGSETKTWIQTEEIAIRPPATGITRLSFADAPVVFVGYGVAAPERNWDDFKDVDVKGKLLLVLVNDPDFETGAGDFGGKAMTYYGRWTYKYEEGARRGALGVLVVHETAPAAYGWETVKNSNDGVFDVVRQDPSREHPPLEAWVQRDTAVAMLAAAGLDFTTLKKQAQGRDFRPVELKGVGLSVDLGVKSERVVSRNVAGVLSGRERPNEHLAYTAHWDHFGIGAPDDRGDRVYNGAIDNASGVAVMLEIARAFGRQPPPRRSVLFLALTAEERGLLGSEHYAAAPLYPLATTVAVLNLDGQRPAGRARDITTAGDAPQTLQDDLARTAAARGRRLSPDPNPAAGSFYRSDHFSFAKRGVPALSIKAGEDLVEGGPAAGAAWRDNYVAKVYHRPNDEFDPTWSGESLAEDAALLYGLGRELADSTRWPEWKAGAEFKAARDASATERR